MPRSSSPLDIEAWEKLRSPAAGRTRRDLDPGEMVKFQLTAGGVLFAGAGVLVKFWLLEGEAALDGAGVVVKF